MASVSLPAKVKIPPSSSPLTVAGYNSKSRATKIMQVNVNSFVTTLSKQSLNFTGKLYLF